MKIEGAGSAVDSTEPGHAAGADEATSLACALHAGLQHMPTSQTTKMLLQAKKDWGEVGEAWAEGDYEAHQSQAIQAKLPLDVPARRHRRPRTAVAEGFSLHADIAVHANDREGLERLCRYGARGPISENRLRRLDEHFYEYTPKRGVTFTLAAADLVRRLVALVPPAKTHLTSFHLRPARRASTPGDLRALTPACRAETEAAQSHQSEAPEARLGLASPAYVRS